MIFRCGAEKQNNENKIYLKINTDSIFLSLFCLTLTFRKYSLLSLSYWSLLQAYIFSLKLYIFWCGPILKFNICMGVCIV